MKNMMLAALAATILGTSAQAALLDFRFQRDAFVDTFQIDTKSGFRKDLTNPDFLYFRTINDANGFDTIFIGDANRDGATGVGLDTGPAVAGGYGLRISPALYSGTGTTIDFPLTTFTGDGATLTISTAAVPEPATWAMMLGGFGLMGAALRRRKAAVRFA